MTDADRRVLESFAARVRVGFPEARIWAFGSRARGDAAEGSDLDVCVVIHRLDRAVWRAISDVAWEVGFENDVLITTVKFDEGSFERGPYSESPLVHNILRDGVAV